MVIGYTTGVFDLFHIGHLNILKNAKALCDKLVVGVTTDELMWEYKKRKPVMPFTERSELVRNVRHVDAVIPQMSMDKFAVWERLKFDIMIVGDDWYNTPKWELIEAKFSELGVRIVFFPYTQGTSSTLLNEILLSKREALAKGDS